MRFVEEKAEIVKQYEQVGIYTKKQVIDILHKLRLEFEQLSETTPDHIWNVDIFEIIDRYIEKMKG